MEDAAQLCDACKVALLKLRKLGSVVEHHSSLEALQKAADRCAICKRIDFSTPTEDHGTSNVKTALYGRLDEDDKDNTAVISAVSYTGRSEDIKYPQDFEDNLLFGNFNISRVLHSTDRLNAAGYSIESYTGSDSCLSLARVWLHTCLSKHNSCERPRTTIQQKEWRPTRLLKIDSEDGLIRLIDKTDVQPGVQYATLSHRWGHLHSKIILTKANIGHWRSCVPPLAASKAIADSVDVARRLGFSHIWIDSLCIIQDSVEDWQQECSLMSNVYKYSSLNIAATSACNNSEGCFWERDTSRKLPLRLCFGESNVSIQSSPSPVPSTNENKTLEVNGKLEGIYDLHDHQTWFFDIGCSPLNSRGWVLQERLLTPRVLNFTKSQLYWECNELQASESHPYDFPNEPYANVQFKTRNPFNVLKEPSGTTNVVEDSLSKPRLTERAFNVWGNAVQAFTRPDSMDGSNDWVENLSVPSDKLVAISAVARELKPFFNSDYLAGHWRTGLIEQLGWRGANMSERPLEYRAPSWSWASVHAPIQHFCGLRFNREEDGDFNLVEILEVQIELASADEFGPVKSGHLRLRGCLLDLEIESLMYSRYGAPSDGEDEQIFFEGKRTVLHIQRDNEKTDFETPRRLQCLPLDISVGDVILFNALLLENAGSKGLYRRVGYVGPNITRDLLKVDIENDPIFRAIGTVDWSEPAATRFKKCIDDVEEITII